jgi:hypothetical protein
MEALAKRKPNIHPFFTSLRKRPRFEQKSDVQKVIELDGNIFHAPTYTANNDLGEHDSDVQKVIEFDGNIFHTPISTCSKDLGEHDIDVQMITELDGNFLHAPTSTCSKDLGEHEIDVQTVIELGDNLYTPALARSRDLLTALIKYTDSVKGKIMTTEWYMYTEKVA